MKHPTASMILLALLIGSMGLPRAKGEPHAKGKDETPDCVHWHTQARYAAYGYDHIVHIDNRCEANADCTVWTDVNPDKIQRSVPRKDDAEVVTYRGSPAREFTAHVLCTLTR